MFHMGKGILLLERGWVIEEVITIYMDCGGYESKRV